MGGFAPTPEEPTAQQPPEGAFAPQQGFEGGEVAGTPPGDPMAAAGGVAEQNGGIFEMFQEMQMGLQNSSDFLMTLSGQFPGAAEPIRRVLEAMQGASQGLIDIIQAVTVEASQPTPSAPRSSFG